MYSSYSVHAARFLFCRAETKAKDPPYISSLYRDRIPVFRRKDKMKHYLEQADAVLREVDSCEQG